MATLLKTVTSAAILAVIGMLPCPAHAAHRDPAAPLATNARPIFGAKRYRVARMFFPGGEGRWDFACLSANGHRLYVTRVTYTMVLDTKNGAVLARIPGGAGAQGVTLLPRLHRGFITNGTGASVTVFDTRNNRVLGQISAAKDADYIIHDKFSKKLLVFCGDSGVMVPIDENVDPKHGKPGKFLNLRGSPEGAVSDNKGHVYVNLADKNLVDVISTRTMQIQRQFKLGSGKLPTGMAMDRQHGVLFIGCRNRRMVVMRAHDGKLLATLPIGAGVDQTAFDGKDALASCGGSGVLTVVGGTKSGGYRVVRNVKTQPGARTMAVDKKRKIIYLPTANLKPVISVFRILVVRKAMRNPTHGPFMVIHRDPIPGPLLKFGKRAQ